MPANRPSSLAERAFNKPYYLFRPRQLLRRMSRTGRQLPDGSAVASVPWGALEVWPQDELGVDVWRTGVFELVVSEAVVRLLEPGETAVDAGANIGYMTCLMASRAGAGRVIAYEPHPEVQRMLRTNAERVSGVTVVGAALSDRSGEAELLIGDEFDRNRGTATLANGSSASGHTVTVPVERLDERLGDAHVGLLKIDVEGHELGVLRGAAGALRARRIRDVVFEENEPLPTPVTSLLEESGYTIFGLDQRLLGPRLVAPDDARARPMWEAPTYLATLDPERARRRMRRRGWRVLRESRPLPTVGPTK